MEEDQFFSDKPQANILVQILQRYLPFWPLLAILLSITLSISFIYLRAQTKIYVAAAKVLLKDPQKGGGDSKVLDALNIFSEKKIVENEILVLRSTSIMQDVVKQLDLMPLYIMKVKYRQKNFTEPMHHFILKHLTKTASMAAVNSLWMWTGKIIRYS